MADYPLLFTLTHEIRCQNFSARVVSHGRALMVMEDGEWWCHGVEPGGITEHGTDPALAYASFKAAYAGILNDLAKDSESLDAFARAVRTFVTDKDATEAERWVRAREEIRAGKPVDEPFSHLRRATEEVFASATVQPLDHISAGEEMVALAEAA